MIDQTKLLDIAAEYHARENQTYAGLPYRVHLEEVKQVLIRFGYTEKSHPILHQAASMHDLFEDTRALPADLISAGADARAVEIALHVTDEEGANRKERKLKTFPKIAADPDAVVLKLADRIANVERKGKMDMYRNEQPLFSSRLRAANPATEPMWLHLEKILNEGG